MGEQPMKPFKHFYTITKHRHKVIAHCFQAGIFWQGLLHDLSKYSPAEFFVSAKYYYGDRSPLHGERLAKGYSLGWMHHKGRNKHHFEYWTDVNPETKQYAPVKMPLCYVKEMFCDRVAASKIYQGKNYTDAYPLQYFRREKIVSSMHEETYKLIESLLVMLCEHGEKETFLYIKNLKSY